MAHYLDISMLSDMVRAKRGYRGLREIAKDCKISPSTISRVERGAVPDIATFLALCDWLEIPPAEFIREAENKLLIDDFHDLSMKIRSVGRLNPLVADALVVLIEAAYRLQT